MRQPFENITPVNPETLINAFIKNPSSALFMHIHRFMQHDIDKIDFITNTLSQYVNLHPVQEHAKKIILYNGFIQTTTEYTTIEKEQFIINAICNSGTPTGKNSDIHWFLLGQLLSKSSHANNLTLPNNWGTIKRYSQCYNHALWKNPSLIVALEEQHKIRTRFINKIQTFDPTIKATDFKNQTKNDYEVLKDATHTAKELHQILIAIPCKSNRLSFLSHFFGTPQNIDLFRHANKPVDKIFVNRIFKNRTDLDLILNTLDKGGKTLKPRQVILDRLTLHMPKKWMTQLENIIAINSGPQQIKNFAGPNILPAPGFFTPATNRQQMAPIVEIEGGEIELPPIPKPVEPVNNLLHRGTGKNRVALSNDLEMEIETPPRPEAALVIETDNTETLDGLVPYIAQVAVAAEVQESVNTDSDAMQIEYTDNNQAPSHQSPKFFRLEEEVSKKRTRDTDEVPSPRPHKK